MKQKREKKDYLCEFTQITFSQLTYRQRLAIARKKDIASRKWYQLAKELRNLLLKPNS